MAFSTLAFQVDGLSCGGCVARVERALSALDGVAEAQAQLATGMVRVSGAELSQTQITEALDKAGYPPRRLQETASRYG